MKEETQSKIKEWCISFMVALIGILGFFGCCYLIVKFTLVKGLLLLCLLVVVIHNRLYE